MVEHTTVEGFSEATGLPVSTIRRHVVTHFNSAAGVLAHRLTDGALMAHLVGRMDQHEADGNRVASIQCRNRIVDHARNMARMVDHG